MAGRKIKVILDTNWYVSATINHRSRRTLYQILANKFISVLYSTELLKEYKEVMGREKFQKIVSEKQIRRFISLVLPKLSEIKIHSQVKASRDSNDNYLLSMSVDANADFLITGDNDLLVLKKIGNTEIVAMDAFKRTMKEIKTK